VCGEQGGAIGKGDGDGVDGGLFVEDMVNVVRDEMTGGARIAEGCRAPLRVYVMYMQSSSLI
jgi:hypothetical protein